MMFPAPCHRAQTPAAMGTCRVRAQRLALSRPRRFTDDGGRLPHASPRPTTQTQDPWPQSAALQRPRECAFPPYSSTHVPGWETEGQRRTAPPSRSREEELGTHLSLSAPSLPPPGSSTPKPTALQAQVPPPWTGPHSVPRPVPSARPSGCKRRTRPAGAGGGASVGMLGGPLSAQGHCRQSKEA